MNTLSIVIFVIGFEGEIKMAGVLQTVMDKFFDSIPEKQFVGFGGEKKDEPKKGLGTKPTVVRDVDFDAYEDMMNKEEKTSSVEVIAKHYSDIIKEESKDPETGQDRASKVNNNVAYTKGVTTVEDVESQGFYVDKILRDNARDPSNKLGSTAAPLNKKEGYYNKIQKLIEKHNKETTYTPYVSSRGVDALEGPEASGPISGPVKTGEKELTSYQAYIKRLEGNKRFGGGLDPEGLASPKRTPRSSRDVDALEGPEALGPTIPSTSKAGIDPFKYDRSPSPDPSSLMAPPSKLYDNWVDAAADRIIQLEGFIGEAEIAFTGEKYPTVGYGKSDSTVQLGDIITEADALVELKKNLIPKKIATAKRLFPAFDTYSPNLKIELLQGVFRGNFKAKHESVKLINKGEWEKASKEFLDYQEYRDAQKIGSNKRGVVFRMDSISDALKDEEYYTANTANP